MGRETDMDFHVGGVKKLWPRRCSGDLFCQWLMLEYHYRGGGGVGGVWGGVRPPNLLVRGGMNSIVSAGGTYAKHWWFFKCRSWFFPKDFNYIIYFSIFFIYTPPPQAFNDIPCIYVLSLKWLKKMIACVFNQVLISFNQTMLPIQFKVKYSCKIWQTI